MESVSSTSSSDWEGQLEVVAALVVIDDDERNKKSTRPWDNDVNTNRE